MSERGDGENQKLDRLRDLLLWDPGAKIESSEDYPGTDRITISGGAAHVSVRMTDQRMTIESLMVRDTQHQNKGRGSSILETLELIARDRGCKKVVAIGVLKPARSFYEQRGYTRIDDYSRSDYEKSISGE